ncbi:MAG TPA: hypothetical protein VG650_15595 [Mycobacteriales bacterium]|nr:hypothetical protein [Mycobacteriales bacterium]
MTSDTHTATDVFADARAIADAVMFEGYVLYPYRASATKNRMRWQWGVLFPPSYAAAHAEAERMSTEVVVDPAPDDRLQLEVRFLQLDHRRVQTAHDGGYRDVARLETTEAVHVDWDEGESRTIAFDLSWDELLTAPISHEVTFPAARREEPIVASGTPAGRLVHEVHAVQLRVRVTATPLDGPYGAVRLGVEVTNDTPFTGAAAASRDEALRAAAAATHMLLALSAGSVLSSAAPPQWAGPAVAGCRHEHCWPVLVGGSDRSHVVLVSPIILDDNPQIAPESPLPLYDGTEIDEILTLRTMTMTEQEKREARGTDTRSAALIDAVDGLPMQVLERLHGAIRSMTAKPKPADPEHETVQIRGVTIGNGSHVRLRPGIRGADAQDLFLDGLAATVQAVLHDVDGGIHVAVSVDGDPLAELQASHGRYRYFRPDELEPLP